MKLTIVLFLFSWYLEWTATILERNLDRHLPMGNNKIFSKSNCWIFFFVFYWFGNKQKTKLKQKKQKEKRRERKQAP